MRLGLRSIRLLGTMSILRHSPPPPEAPAAKQPRREQGVAPRPRSEKLERKRLHNLRKNYERSVAKNGEPPILHDIREMIGAERIAQILTNGTEFDRVSPMNEEVSVTIERLSAHGNGLALSPNGDRVIAVPFALPGETVRVYPYGLERLYFKARVVERLSSSPMRQDDLVACRYFGTCGGCQYQMIPYEQQLELKQHVVLNAYKHYAGLDESLLPDVLPTMGSPAIMGYRTKLTPHFDLPTAIRKGTAGDDFPPVPIGFDNVATGRVMDIEECPIGTPAINAALPRERQSVRDRIKSYKNGATLLLRDSLRDFETGDSVVVTDHKATVHEMVGKTRFSSPAGAFFQNNRSIIPLVIEYIEAQNLFSKDAPQYLVDTYCGSGLFALSLAPLFQEVAGVEISAASIECAKNNAEMNGIRNAKFLARNAENIFASISYPPEHTTVVIDPPRRGCDEEFIKQLVALRPAHIVYVSCNVHTQARDVGMIVRACPSYRVHSIRGFDFFPQTQCVTANQSRRGHLCARKHGVLEPNEAREAASDQRTPSNAEPGPRHPERNVCKLHHHSCY